jgi:GntR family transcriptional regulator
VTDLAVPEYRRIRDQLRAQLEDGVLKPGDKMPTERELVERFGVAHMTVRHAVDGLVRDGLVVRRRGSGTFVVHTRAISRSMNRLQSFSDDVGSESTSSRVLRQVETAPSPEVTEKLELPRAGKVVDLLRLRSIDGVAAAIHQVYIPVRVAPALVREDMANRSLYDYLTSAGVALERAKQRVFAVAAAEEHAELLGIAVGSPLLAGERLTRDSDNLPVEYARTWSLPDLSVWVEMRR